MTRKMTIADLISKKEKVEKVTFITAYDANTARIAEAAGVGLILIGDSVGNNVLGYDSTIPVTMEDMVRHSAAVRRGAPNTHLVGDMPLGSYQPSDRDAVLNAIRFLKEGGVDTVKCEGGVRMAGRIEAMVNAGVGVMGHIGYTPQSTNLGTVVQGKSLESFNALLDDALAVQNAGAYAVLLEAVPNYPASLIAKKLNIPVYGIGAGVDVDGVLGIVNDVIGLGTFAAKFVRKFGDVEGEMAKAISGYVEAVTKGSYPGEENMYKLSKVEEEAIRAKHDQSGI